MKTLTEKWNWLLDADDSTPIKNSKVRADMARIFENISEENQSQAKAQGLNEAADGTGSGSAEYQDGILMPIVRRVMPAMIAYDVCGVSPMTGPVDLIFALKARYGIADSEGGADPITTSDTEALFNVADNGFSGTGSSPAGVGKATADAEGDITATWV